MKPSPIFLAVMMMAAPSSRAQVFTDGSTNTLVGELEITGDVTVGTNGSFTLLVLAGNALLTNSANGVISRNATARTNEVRLVSPGARWLMGGSLFVGSNGSAAKLVVSNGATVLAGSSSTIGHGGDFSGNANSNTVTVSGAGSLWSSGLDLIVGELGSANRLEVNNGGRVLNSNAFVGRSLFSPSNTVVVTGTGSLWSNRADVSLGGVGSGNLLVVSNGGWVVNSNASVGGSSLGNLALLTGTNSTWSNRADLYVGNGARGNHLVVSDGATIFVGRNGVIGFSSNASSNSVTVTDPGTSCTVATNLYVGSNGALNRLIITNGARVENGFAAIGNNLSSSNNEVVITGAGSIWSNRSSLYVGGSGSGNRLIVTNGGFLRSVVGELGNDAASRSNVVVITDAGSFWDMPSILAVGSIGSGNRLVVTNGGWLRSVGAFIGFASTNNEVVVTGAGSAWTNLSDLFVGHSGSGNLLVVTNGGEFFGVGGVILGRDASSTNNRVTVDGGTLRAQDPGGTAFDVRRGTTILNAGLIEVDRLLLTNAGGFFQFHGGTLSSANSRVSHGTLFDIGKGTSPATFLLAGNGLHEFTGILAARVASNATFTGNGTIGGVVPLQFFPGSRLVPGTSVGKMIFSNSPALQGTVVMEISKNGGTLTNDQIQVIAPLTYGGSLVLSNLGPTALAAGDRFPLFSASGYAGGFTNIILPPLSPGLGWTNKLLVDGSIEVVVGPQFTSINLSGTNIIFAGTGGIANAPYAVLTTTNVVEPSGNWVSLVTNQFGLGGEFSFTNGILPGELQRYFRIRSP